MTKKDFAKIQAYVMRAEQLLDHTVDSVAENIASQISLLTNVDPASALSVLEQLNAQKPMIEQALKERKEKDKGLADHIEKGLPPVIEFDEDHDDDTDEESDIS